MTDGGQCIDISEQEGKIVNSILVNAYRYMSSMDCHNHDVPPNMEVVADQGRRTWQVQ